MKSPTKPLVDEWSSPVPRLDAEEGTRFAAATHAVEGTRFVAAARPNRLGGTNVLDVPSIGYADTPSQKEVRGMHTPASQGEKYQAASRTGKHIAPHNNP